MFTKRGITLLCGLVGASCGDNIVLNHTFPIALMSDGVDFFWGGFRQSLAFEYSVNKSLGVEFGMNREFYWTMATDMQDVRWDSYGYSVSLTYLPDSFWFIDVRTKGGVGYTHMDGEKEAFSAGPEFDSQPYEKVDADRVYALAELGIRMNFWKKKIFVDVNPFFVGAGYKYRVVNPNMGIGIHF